MYLEEVSTLLRLAKNAGQQSKSLSKFLLLAHQVLFVGLSFVQQWLQATRIHQFVLVDITACVRNSYTVKRLEKHIMPISRDQGRLRPYRTTQSTLRAYKILRGDCFGNSGGTLEGIKYREIRHICLTNISLMTANGKGRGKGKGEGRGKGEMAYCSQGDRRPWQGRHFTCMLCRGYMWKKSFWNNVDIISVFYVACNHVSNYFNYFKIISTAKLGQVQLPPKSSHTWVSP